MPLNLPGAAEAFQIGQQAEGISALGQFVSNLVERVNKMDLLKAEVGAKYGMELPYQVALEKAKIQLDPEKRILSSLADQVPSGSPGGLGGFGGLQQNLPAGQSVKLGPFNLQSTQLTPEQQAGLEDRAKITPVTGFGKMPFLANTTQDENAVKLRTVAATIKNPQDLQKYLATHVSSGSIRQEHADQIYNEIFGGGSAVQGNAVNPQDIVDELRKRGLVR